MAAAMVGRYRRILREAAVRFKPSAASPSCWSCPQGAKRYLLPENIIQLQTFQEHKLQTEYKRYGEKDILFDTLEDKLKHHRLILRDELKTVLHMCQSKGDVELIKRVIYRYHEENKNTAFGEYKFGPLFMRLCYELDLENVALELIKDQALHGFFSDTTSFNILMDMLFTKHLYESALEVLMEMKQQDVKFNKETYLLACAICYKLNSTESCRICHALVEEAALKQFILPRRAYYFTVALFLKQNDVEKACLYYCQINKTGSQICSNLNILLQAASRNLNNLIHTLEKALDCYTPPFVKKTAFSMEVLCTVKEKLYKNPDLSARFENVFAKLEDLGQVTSLTMDDLLCQTPGTRRHSQWQRQTSRRTSHPLSSSLLAE